MKITAIDVIGLRADHDAPDSGSESCVVEVRTDSGLSGIAESASAACLVHAAIEGQAGSRIYPGLASLVMGREPLDIEALWQHMYRSNRFIGRRGAVIHGISAIDTALWDLKGKAEGVAVADLLGGPKRDRLRAYGTVWPTGNSVDDLRRNIDRGLALGLREIKLCATPEWAADPALTATLANAARAHVGDDVALYLDGTEKWPTAAAAASTAACFAAAACSLTALSNIGTPLSSASRIASTARRRPSCEPKSATTSTPRSRGRVAAAIRPRRSDYSSTNWRRATIFP